jgi:hypothetical protein
MTVRHFLLVLLALSLVAACSSRGGALSGSQGEWFEVYNASSVAFDLSGMELADNGTNAVLISPGVPLIFQPGTYGVLANSTVAATNGGVPAVRGWGGSFILANGEDEIIIRPPGGMAVLELLYNQGDVSWPDSEGNASQLDAFFTPPSASASNDLSNWCTPSAAVAFGLGDRGTPGYANITCPAR